MQPLMLLIKTYGLQHMHLLVGAMYVYRSESTNFLCGKCFLILILFYSDFQMDILEMLAMSGADLNAKNKNDETPSG